MNKSNGADLSSGPYIQPKVNIVAQHVRDLSFENFLAQEERNIVQAPDVKFSVEISSKEFKGNIYSVSVKLTIDAKTKKDGEPVFLLELDYEGRFLIENLGHDQLKSYLLVECPKLLFPYIRRLVDDLTSEGGFPPLKMNPIDFAEIFNRNSARA